MYGVHLAAERSLERICVADVLGRRPELFSTTGRIHSFNKAVRENERFSCFAVDQQSGAFPGFLRFGERKHLIVPELDEVVDFVEGNLDTQHSDVHDIASLYLECQRQLETKRSPSDAGIAEHRCVDE
jgi:hypothetical protein